MAKHKKISMTVEKPILVSQLTRAGILFTLLDKQFLNSLTILLKQQHYTLRIRT